MAKIAFVMWPAMGHLNPTLKLARKLQQSGHRVSYLGLSSLEKYVLSQGFEFYTVLPETSDFDQLMKIGVSKPGAQITQALSRIQPDLLIIDEFLRVLAVLAGKIGIPSMFVSTKLNEHPLNTSNVVSGDSVSGSPTLVLCPAVFDFPYLAGQKGRHYVEASIDLKRSEALPFP